ncbi:MAG: S1C family serine protease [Roseiarcus sp.]|jgi:S1-C subfamily serine protease
MIEKSRREAPARDQAKPEAFGFDLNHALESIVALQSEIPEDGFTASTLGVKRAGSGVVIRESGLVLTIGYLITEAESVWLTSAGGRLTPAHALAADSETGFGLVQALDRLDLPALDLGSSSEAQPGDPVIVAAGGRRQFLHASIVGKHEFTGYWEYLLQEAIFTAPAHPFWGGAGVIGSDGKLLGVGSLHVEHAIEQGEPRDVNMVVPIDLLAPILDDLLRFGRVDKPPRPWLGVYSTESEGRIVIAGLAERGPAAAAGVRRGDVVSAVGGSSVASLADFYRKVWSHGPAGVEIPIEVLRDHRSVWLRIRSTDRSGNFKRPRLH